MARKVLKRSNGLAVLGLLVLAGPIPLIFLTVGSRTAEWMSCAVLCGIVLVAVFCAVVVIDGPFTHITFDEGGIYTSSPFSRTRSLRWSEIYFVRWEDSLGRIALSGDKTAIRISAPLRGPAARAFATECLARAPADVFSKVASAALQLIKMGKGQALGGAAWNEAHEAPKKRLGKILGSEARRGPGSRR
jgi:hypothetical protein